MISRPFIKESEPYNFWTGWQVTFGALGTGIMGIAGLLLNSIDWFEKQNWSPTLKEVLIGGLESEPSKATIFASILADNPAFAQCINEVEAITGIGDAVSMMISMVLFILSGIRIVLNATGLGWIIELILLLVKSHFPSAITGMNMLVSSYINFSDSLANLPIFWGDYEVLHPVLPLA